RFVWAMVVTLFATDPSLAATYLVSPSGNDANPGSSSAPWRTLQKAANSVAPGDTVLVAGGTYKEQVSINRSGTAANPIVFKNQGATPAILDGTGLAAPSYSALLTISNVSYVAISGLTVRQFGSWCVVVGGTSNNID